MSVFGYLNQQNWGKLLLIDDRLAIPGVPDTSQAKGCLRCFSPGSPTQTNAVFVVGRSRGLVALLWRKAPSVAPSAEGECKGTANFWHLQLFGQKNALQNSDCLYPLIAMQLRGLGWQNLGCWKNFSFFCRKICIYPTLYQSNSYGALLMPRFAPIAPHRPIYRTLEFLSSFWEFVERFFASLPCQFFSPIPRLHTKNVKQRFQPNKKIGE